MIEGLDGNAPAPATPAPAATPQTATPTPAPGTPALSAVEQASADARARLAATGTIAPAPPHHAQTQPRIEKGNEKGGQFVPSAVKEVGANVATGEEETPPEAGQPAETDEQQPIEGQEGQEEEQLLEGAGEEEVDPDLLVEIPGRNPGESLEIAVDDPETADRLRQLANSAMRGEEARAVLQDAQQRVQQVEEFEDMIQADPAGVFERALADDPRTQAHLALYLFTRPAIQKLVGETLQKAGVEIVDDAAFENLALRMENERHTLRENYSAVAEERRAVSANLAQIQAAVGAIIPPQLQDQARDVFFRDALRDVALYAEQHNMLTVPVQHIPLVLAARMAASGIDPVQAASRMQAALTGGGAGNRSSGNGAAGAKPAKNGAAPPPQAPQRTGAQMVAGAKKRTVAAKVPGAGAGTGNPPPVIPPYDPTKPGSAIEQATAAHRAALQQGRKVV